MLSRRTNVILGHLVLAEKRNPRCWRVSQRFGPDRDPVVRTAVRGGAGAALALFLLLGCSAPGTQQYFHPQAAISSDLSSPLFDDAEHRPITPRQAALYAIERLQARGVENPVICEAQWIAAPLSGYLVDALGTMESGDATYTLLRVGIRDGLEHADGLRAAGEEFVFLALGRDSSGNSAWHPSPGPDYTPGEGEPVDDLLPYEFLLWRDRFETLSRRYPLNRVSGR
jgi:hypothetical protein